MNSAMQLLLSGNNHYDAIIIITSMNIHELDHAVAAVTTVVLFLALVGIFVNSAM